MHKIICTLLPCCFLFFQNVKAQFVDRLIPHFGYMYTFLPVENTDVEEGGSGSYSFNSLSLGTYITLKHHNDWLSVGIDPSINVALSIDRGGHISQLTQLPVFLMGRIGANSTKFNTHKIGLGAGIGCIATSLKVGDEGFFETKARWLQPAAVVEANIRPRKGVLTARASFSLGRAYVEGDLITATSFLPDRDLTIKTISLGLIYGF